LKFAATVLVFLLDGFDVAENILQCFLFGLVLRLFHPLGKDFTQIKKQIERAFDFLEFERPVPLASIFWSSSVPFPWLSSVIVKHPCGCFASIREAPAGPKATRAMSWGDALGRCAGRDDNRGPASAQLRLQFHPDQQLIALQLL
jgi:hypothetical protein